MTSPMDRRRRSSSRNAAAAADADAPTADEWLDQLIRQRNHQQGHRRQHVGTIHELDEAGVVHRGQGQRASRASSVPSVRGEGQQQGSRIAESSGGRAAQEQGEQAGASGREGVQQVARLRAEVRSVAGSQGQGQPQG